MPKYIGLGHYRRTGKDTLARNIENECDVRGIQCVVESLADELKYLAYNLYAWAGLELSGYYDHPAHEHEREIELPVIGKSPRQIWIDLGTTAIRNHVYEDTWIDLVFHNTDCLDGVVVVPDVRFPNEVLKLRQKDAILVKVIRPGYRPGPDRPDQALVGYDGWDHVTGHTGELEELQKFAVTLVEKIGQ